MFLGGISLALRLVVCVRWVVCRSGVLAGDDLECWWLEMQKRASTRRLALFACVCALLLDKPGRLTFRVGCFILC